MLVKYQVIFVYANFRQAFYFQKERLNLVLYLQLVAVLEVQLRNAAHSSVYLHQFAS